MPMEGFGTGTKKEIESFGTTTPAGGYAGKTVVYALSQAASNHGYWHANDQRISESVQMATNRWATVGVLSRNTNTLTPRMRSSITAAINRRDVSHSSPAPKSITA